MIGILSRISENLNQSRFDVNQHARKYSLVRYKPFVVWLQMVGSGTTDEL